MLLACNVISSSGSRVQQLLQVQCCRRCTAVWGCSFPGAASCSTTAALQRLLADISDWTRTEPQPQWRAREGSLATNTAALCIAADRSPPASILPVAVAVAVAVVELEVGRLTVCAAITCYGRGKCSFSRCSRQVNLIICTVWLQLQTIYISSAFTLNNVYISFYNVLNELCYFTLFKCLIFRFNFPDGWSAVLSPAVQWPPCTTV